MVDLGEWIEGFWEFERWHHSGILMDSFRRVSDGLFESIAGYGRYENGHQYVELVSMSRCRLLVDRYSLIRFGLLSEPGSRYAPSI